MAIDGEGLGASDDFQRAQLRLTKRRPRGPCTLFDTCETLLEQRTQVAYRPEHQMEEHTGP